MAEALRANIGWKFQV